jgi:hypothetical protein
MERLSQAERKELFRWQRRMVTVFVATMACLFLLVGVDLLVGLTSRQAGFAMVSLVGLAALGVYLQLSQRCPRCRYRIGYQSRLLVPERCKCCGVGFR